MANQDSLYKCEICGNLCGVAEAHQGILTCCNQEMKELSVITGNEGLEKHKPVITKEGEVVTIKVGSVEHPMEEKHYIGLIQLLHNGKVIKEKRLNFNSKPIARFIAPQDIKELSARAYCNLHGFWGN